MTPPTAASTSASASVQPKQSPPPASSSSTNAPAAPAKPAPLETKEATITDDSPNMKIIPSGTFGMGWGSQGGINGGPFAIKSQSQFGDYTQLQTNFSLLFDVFGFGGDSKKARFRVGPRLDLNGTFGNENTGYSKYFQATLAPQLELDWARAWGTGLGNFLKGPSYFNLWAGLGYGSGTGTAETFSLHDQKGMAWNMGASLNLFNFNIYSLQVGTDAVFQTTGIDGSKHNSPGNYFGFGLTFRPGTNKVVRTEKFEKCDDVPTKINDYALKNLELRAQNTKIKEDLDTLRSFLEKGENPITTEKIQKALYYREVRKSIETALPKVPEKDLRTAIRAAFDAKTDSDADASLKKSIPGLTDSILSKAREEANTKYPVGYDFWAQIPANPAEVRLPDPMPTDCKALDDLYDQLVEENAKLRERKTGLTGRFDTAILLDALRDHLGKAVEKFVDKAHGFVLDFVQPNFTTGKAGDPKVADMVRLRKFAAENKGKEISPNNKELIKIVKDAPGVGFFALPEFELQNLKDIADKMNGKLDPSYSRTFNDKSSAMVFAPAPALKPEDKGKWEWMKDITWTIEGHTDSTGTNADNQGLSERRSEAIKIILELFGVPPANLKSIGYGEERLAVPEKGDGKQVETARTKNRRVVIRVSGEATPSAPLHSIPDGMEPKATLPGNINTANSNTTKPAGAAAKATTPAPAPKPAPATPTSAPSPAPAPKTSPKGIKFDE